MVLIITAFLSIAIISQYCHSFLYPVYINEIRLIELFLSLFILFGSLAGYFLVIASFLFSLYIAIHAIAGIPSVQITSDGIVIA